MRRRNWRWVLLAGVALAACTPSRPKSGAAPIALPVAPASVASVASASAAPPPPSPARPSACHPPAPGTTSDDESPTIRGATGNVDLIEWLAARGIDRDAAITWLAAHYGQGLTKEQAEAAFAYSRCGALRVGDKNEEALICEHAFPTLLVQVHALTLVVRSKRPVVVLDVGVGMIAMDFPDARSLDLALAMAPDGKSAELTDRAPDGTTLVRSQSSCLAEEKLVAECEEKLAAHPNPESFAHKTGHGETIDKLDDCPLYRGHDGRIAVLRQSDMQPPFSSTPATLHDCAGGRERLKRMQSDLVQAPPQQRADARQSLAFYEKICAQRGRYVWQKDRFAKVVK